MPTYRPVSCRFWNDADIEDLSPEAKLVFLFLFTNDSTTESGIYGISEKRISERTGIPEKRCAEILDKDLKSKITYDHEKKIIFIHSFLHCNNRGAPALILNSLLKNARDFQSALCWLSFVRIYKDKHYINKIIYLIKTFPSVSKDFAKSSLKIEDLSFNDFLKSFEVKDARVESEQGKAGDADEPITPEANAQLEKSPAHEKDNPGAGRIVDEPQPAPVILPDHLTEIWPDYLEMRRRIRKTATHKAESLALKTLQRLSTDPKIQIKIIEQSIENSWQGLFELKGPLHSQGAPTRQDRALERPAPAPWVSYDQRQREADVEAKRLEEKARQNRKEPPVIIPGFKMPELKEIP